MKYLSKPLMNELRSKYAVLKTAEHDPWAECRKIVSKKILNNAQVDSYRIEHPLDHLNFSIPRNSKKKAIKQGIKNIEDAFLWGVNNFHPESINESFIREIAGRILPDLYDGPLAQYRSSGVRIVGATTIPPDSYKLINREIPEFIDSLKTQLTCKDVVNRIETAIFSHLQIARMHPFPDGNGRTARTLQDVILYYYGIPSPVIEPGERYTYYSCLDKAVSGWMDKKAYDIHNGATEGELLLYNFIAGKINSSFDNILNKCLKCKR
jgi:Fic family protein